ncbi:UDP-glycosyltransferase 79B8 [Abeliophyllum distichum]|uniref:UDP-glycosyltransferase 79B8 n=1 Tax=Abeliophyllum distichum TaxID=126358 RepID=A0ABD1T1X7_9LAMI
MAADTHMAERSRNAAGEFTEISTGLNSIKTRGVGSQDKAAINLSSISKAIEKHLCKISIQLVELHLPSWPELPPHYHMTKNVPPDLLPRLLEAFQMSSSSFTDIFKILKPDLLMYDCFQPWSATLASSLGIPAVLYSSAGAIMYTFYYHEFTYGNDNFPYKAIYVKDHERINWKYRSVIKDAGEDFAFGNFKRSCDIVLMNSCRAIEGKYIDYFSILCQKKVVTVGPLVTKSDGEEDYPEIMEWLSKKNQFSTVFISIGSENYLSKEQIEEMTRGLELCDVNFIWVVRFPVGNTIRIEETLPEGFLDGVKERGPPNLRVGPEPENRHIAGGEFWKQDTKKRIEDQVTGLKILQPGSRVLFTFSFAGT